MLQPDLERFIAAIRELGLSVKLDTNGGTPLRLKNMLAKGLVDYVAMDIKNTPEKYPETVGLDGYNPIPVFESAAVIMESGVPYEFRTTLVKGFHTAEDMETLGRLLAGAEKYYLQSFKDSGDLIGFGDFPAFEMAPPSKSDIEAFRDILSRHIKTVEIRG